MVKTTCAICNQNFKDESSLAMHTAAKHSSIPVQKKKSKTLFIIIGIVAILVIGLYFLISSQASSSSTGNAVQDSKTQQVTIGFGSSGYTPNTITVKAGEPVAISLDNSVGGCFRAFKIPSLSISKYSTDPSDTIKFTPTEKGTYSFQCGMGMARGTLIVD